MACPFVLCKIYVASWKRKVVILLVGNASKLPYFRFAIEPIILFMSVSIMFNYLSTLNLTYLILIGWRKHDLIVREFQEKSFSKELFTLKIFTWIISIIVRKWVWKKNIWCWKKWIVTTCYCHFGLIRWCDLIYLRLSDLGNFSLVHITLCITGQRKRIPRFPLPWLLHRELFFSGSIKFPLSMRSFIYYVRKIFRKNNIYPWYAR